jgi:multicomponent Na+:H+ antiporter subunit F
MNAWLVSAAVLLVALVPCAVTCLRGKPTDRLVGLEMGAIILTLELILLAQGFQRVSFYDLAVALALLSFGGGLVFARFLERWL